MIEIFKINSLLQHHKIFSSLIAGFILGTIEITFVLAFTALIFPDELSDFFTLGMAILLFGTVICFTMLALFSAYRGTIGGAQDIPASISAVMAASIVATMGNESDSFIIFSTVVTAMALASLISALLLITMGLSGLGKIIRFIPYPVIGGLLLSTGWILSHAGFGMMGGHWLIGAVFAVLLLFARRFIRSPWILPVFLVMAITIINAYLTVMGISVETAREQGFLLDIELEKIPFIPHPADIIYAAELRIVLDQFPTIISLCLVTCLAILIQISTIEVVVKQEIDPRRELCVTGFANLIVAFCCGLINYHHISGTTLAYNMGARARTAGVFTAMVCMVIFLTNSRWMEFVPLPVLAGLILYQGLEFIYQWLVLGYRQLPRIEFLIMLAIFACAIFVNFPTAIMVGLFCGTVLFLIQYNTVGIIQAVFSADDCKSSVMRAAKQSDYLASQPHSITAFKLKGMLYFGTAHELYAATRQLISQGDPEDKKYIIFDFEYVPAIDSTALMSLLRTHQLLNDLKIELIMSSLTGAQINLIKTFYANHNLIYSLHITDTLDRAIEYCEDRLLTAANLIDIEESGYLESIFKKQGWSELSIMRLKRYMHKEVLHDHQLLIRSGENNDDIYFINSGKLEIISRKTDGPPLRLRVLMPGEAVGEMSLYTGMPRSADVIAKGDTTVYKLSSIQLKLLQDEDPDMAIKLHKYFARTMAERFLEESRLQPIRSTSA